MAFPVWRSLGTTLGIVLAAVGVVLGFYIFPNLIHNKIEENSKLVNGTDAYERWQNTPVPVQFKVYFFTILNPDEVKLGAIPNVKEVGPYVYNQIRNKSDIYEEEDTLSYNQAQLFSFNQKASGDNKEDDVITIANLPLMSMVTLAERKGRLGTIAINRHLENLLEENSDLFITTTPRDFLFDGIIIHCNKTVKLQSEFKRICNEIRTSGTRQMQPLEDGRLKFSFLTFKNTTDDRRFKINSGVKKIDSLGEVIEWGNSSKLNVWNENGTCNNLYGTDSTIYPPYRTKESKIDVFQADICRVVNLHYKEESEYKGLSSIKFTVDSDQLASAAISPDNQCYCVGETKGILAEDGCLLDGAMELFTCLKAPVVFTFPHFFEANEKYQNGVTGLKPNETLHKTFAELEPSTGLVLRGSKRAQFNIFYRPIKDIKILKKSRETLMPVIWVDEGIELDDDNVKLLDDKLFSILRTLNIVKWSIIGAGGVITLIFLISFFVV